MNFDYVFIYLLVKYTKTNNQMEQPEKFYMIFTKEYTSINVKIWVTYTNIKVKKSQKKVKLVSIIHVN